MRGSYDIVLANILAPTLIELADDLRRVLLPDGALVISGILADAHEHVLRALLPLRVVDRSDDGMWTAITLRW
jgi:ribosomal protein L11 methyltransferase